jgi:hypothetical protein
MKGMQLPYLDFYISIAFRLFNYSYNVVYSTLKLKSWGNKQESAQLIYLHRNEILQNHIFSLHAYISIELMPE